MKYLRCGLLLLVVSFPIYSQNLVYNSDLSVIKNGKPDGWMVSGDKGVKQTLSVVEERGDTFLRLHCSEYVRTGGASHAMIAQYDRVSITEGKMYLFTCRIRGLIQSRTAKVAISDAKNWRNCGLMSNMRVNGSWSNISIPFTATKTPEKTRLQIWFTETGVLDVADISIVETRQNRIVFTDTVASTGSRNLIPNGSFEAGTAGWSSVGQGAAWSANIVRLHGRIIPEGGAVGSAFLRIPLGGDNTPLLYGDYLRSQFRREIQTLAANLHWIPVDRKKKYTVSCWMRSDAEGMNAILGVRSLEHGKWKVDQRTRVTLTGEWKQYSYTFSPARGFVYVVAGPDPDTETICSVDVDGVQLEEGDQAGDYVPRAQIEAGILSSEDAGIFLTGGENSITFAGFNNSDQERRVPFTVRVTDYFDRPVSFQPVELVIPGHSRAEKTYPVPSDWRGYYRIKAEYNSGTVTEHLLCRIAVVRSQNGNDTLLGVNHAFGTAFLIQQAAKAGISWYRDWTIKWKDIEPKEGERNWERADIQFDRVLKEGMNLMGLLPAFPSADWNSEAPAGIPDKGWASRLKEAWAPKDPEKLGDFTMEGAKRYMGRVEVWEFLNEPVFTSYSLPGEGREKKYKGKRYTPSDYVDLLRVASKGIKKGNPGCRIVGGIGGGPQTFTKEVIEAGCLTYIDILNLHIYPGSRLPETYIPEMNELLQTMGTKGGKTPIWITEFSYYGVDNLPFDPFIPGRDWATRRFLSGGEKEVSDLTLRFILLMLSRGVEKIFLHSGRCGSVNEPAHECCLFDYGGVPRKCVPALAFLCKLLGSAPVPAGEKILHDNVYAFAFEANGRSVTAVWTSYDDGSTCVLHTPSNSIVFDVMGNKLVSPAFRLGASPLYLLSKPGTAKNILGFLNVEKKGGFTFVPEPEVEKDADPEPVKEQPKPEPPKTQPKHQRPKAKPEPPKKEEEIEVF